MRIYKKTCWGVYWGATSLWWYLYLNTQRLLAESLVKNLRGGRAFDYLTGAMRYTVLEFTMQMPQDFDVSLRPYS